MCAVVINVYGKADLKQIERAEKQLSGLKREVGGQTGTWSKFGSVVSSTGAKIASGLAAAGLGVFLKNSISAASDLSESTSKATVVYGKHAGAIIEWSKSAASGLGMSQQAALEAAGTYGNLFTAMGMGQPKAASMSTSLIALATDLASFNNQDPTLVLEKLRAGLVGETEPLRSLGVNLTAAGVQQEAYRLGLAKTGAELTASQKAQASYSLIMAQTKTAQGDFARTSGGLANQQRILKASFVDLSAKVGTAVLPIVTSLTTKAVSLLNGFMKLPGPVQKVAIVLAAAGAASAILMPWIASMGKAIPVVTGAYNLLFVAKTKDGIVTRAGLVQYGILRAKMLAQAVASKAVAAAQWLVNAAMSANPIGLIVLAIVGLVAVFVVLWKKCDWFRNFWIGLWERVKSVAAAVWPVIKAVGEKIVGALKWAWDKVSAGVRWFWGWAGGFITAAVTAWWTQIKLTVTVIVLVIRTAWNAIRTVTTTVWNAIRSVVQTQVRAIVAVIHTVQAIVGFLAGVWARIKAGAAAAIGAVVGVFRSLGSKIKNAIGNQTKLLYNIGQDIVRGLLNGITNAWHWITDKLHDLIGGLSSAAKKLLGINSPSRVFAEIGRSVTEGFALGIDSSSRVVSEAVARMAAAGTGARGSGAPAFAGGYAGGGSSSRSVVIMPGAVQVTISGDAAGSPASIEAAARAGTEPALERLGRELKAL